ncbi:MAG: tRNA (adenine(22)-N(1))-methyltransferase, partial [Cellulosilyticaceae bacterium]
LESAKRHMDQNGLQNIDLRLGSGLSTVDPEEGVEVAIIAGMGGLLIIDILRNDLAVVKGLKKLILQPQSNLLEVRKFVHEIGFKIEEERFLLDEGKYYTILSLVPGSECYDNAYEYEYGKYLINHPNPTYLQWLDHKKAVFEKIKVSIQAADEDTRIKREAALMEEIKVYEEAMACIASEKL